MPAGGINGINSLGFVGGAGSSTSGSNAGGGGGGGASVLKLNGANIAVAAGGGGGAGAGASTHATYRPAYANSAAIFGSAGNVSVEGGNGGGGGGLYGGAGGNSAADGSGVNGSTGASILPAGWISNVANNGGDFHTAGNQGFVIIAYYQP